MASSKSDFAWPWLKMLGCFVLVCAYPAVFVAGVNGVDLPWTIELPSVVLSLAGLGGLLGRPNTIVEALRTIRPLFKRE